MSIPNRIAVLNSDGTTDTGFDPGAGLNAAGRAVSVLQTGEIAAGGDFTMVSGSVVAKLAFFEPDGTLEESLEEPDGTVNALLSQTDGKIGVAGAFTQLSAARNRIAFLGADKTLETAYNPNANGTVFGLLNQADGKTIAVGAFTSVGGITRNKVVRLFNEPSSTTLTVQTVSLVRWLRGGSSQEIERVSFDLSTDGGATFTDLAGTITRVSGGWQIALSSPLTGSGLVRARAYPTDSHNEGIISEQVTFNVNPEIQVSQDGTILVSGSSTVAYSDLQLGSNAIKEFTITNLGLTNLTLTGTHVTLTTGTQWAVVSQPLSPITPGSSVTFSLRFTPTSAGAKTDTVSINNNDSDENPFTFTITGTCTPGPGSVDTTWQPVLNAEALTAIQSSQELTWLGGPFTTVNALNRLRFARLNNTAVVQNQVGSIANGSVFCICQTFDNKYLIGGSFTSVSGVVRNRLARFNADGSFDASFNVSVNGNVLSLALQADGSVVVGGQFTTFGGLARSGLAKLTPTGAVDSSFNTGVTGIARAVTQTDGKLIVFGTFLTPGSILTDLVRLSADGTVDATFVSGVNGPVQSVVITADGKIVAGGTYTTIGGVTKTGVNRISATGSHDATFAEYQADALTLALQCDGKVIVGGYVSGSLGATERLARRKTDGTNDATFVATARNAVYGVTLQEDGKAVVTGNFTLAGSTPKYAARVLNDASGAVSTVSVISNSEVQWLRSGPIPETQIVVFDYSQDGGTTWTRAGQASRISGGWALTSANLPVSGILRAQAVVSCGYGNGSTSIHEEQVAFSNLSVGDMVVEYPVGTLKVEGSTAAFAGTIPGQVTTGVFTLRNTGNATITGIAASASGDFSILSAPATSLAPNGSTTLTVQFAPTAVGARGPVALSITSSLPGVKNPYTVLMTGSGVTTPTATTGTNSAPSSGQRTLNGTFRPNHDTAAASFQYKLASSTTWLNTPTSAVGGFANVNVARTITGLTVGQTYQYRALIYNAVNAGQDPAAPFVGATLSFVAT